MNVLHICSYFLGTQLYQNLVDALEQNDTDNSVYIPTINGTLASFQIHDYVDVSYCLNKYDRVIFHYKHNKILRDFYSKYNPGEFDIIHAHTLFSNGYIAWQIYEQYNVPYIVAVRNTDINTFFRYMPHLRRMGIEILKKSKRIIFLSEAYKDELLKKYIPIGLHSSILEKFEKMLRQERKKMYEEEVKPMTLDQYEKRIDSALDDYKNKRVTNAKKLKKEISSWK